MSIHRRSALSLLALGALTGALGCGASGSKPEGNISLFPLLAEGWLNGSAPSQQALAGKVVVVSAWAFW